MSSKPLIRDPETNRLSPFLGGILVQSLVRVGLSFGDAYDIAQHVRALLERRPGPVEAPELRALVAEHLEQRFGAPIRLAYVLGQHSEQSLRVRTGKRDEAFSVGVLTRRLEGSGIRYEDAMQTARRVEQRLRENSNAVVERDALRRLVFETLQSHRPDVADHYLSRCQFRDSGLPLILLIGGATGVGKSTAATRMATLLDILRIQSTDMMREIIRCYLMPHVAPTLQYSSFDAWKGLPGIDPLLDQRTPDNLIVSGFLAQFGNIKVAIEATIARAVKEREYLIVEGVHVIPSRLDLTTIGDKALVIPLMLALTTRDRLEAHLTRRTREQPERGSDGQRRRIDEIWHLQAYMIDQAERSGVPVIAVRGADETVISVMEVVMRQMAARFPANPDMAMGAHSRTGLPQSFDPAGRSATGT